MRKKCARLCYHSFRSDVRHVFGEHLGSSLLGDNRDSSQDSRIWGTVKDTIKGKAKDRLEMSPL
jgi:hypothetical protein